jgi:hypothetical protein
MEEIAQQKLQEIKAQQRKDSELSDIILYLENDQLPEDAAKAKKAALEIAGCPPVLIPVKHYGQ